MSEGVGDLLFFVASVLPVGWGISKVLTFVDERGLRRVSCIHVLSHPQRRPRWTTLRYCVDLYFFPIKLRAQELFIMTSYVSVDSLI